MLGIPSQEIQNDFINELKSYIPALTHLADELDTHKGGNGQLTEMHRLVHTVKGASSLVKLRNLSSVAAELETVIERLLDHRLELVPSVFDAIQAALAYFDQYSSPDNGTPPSDHNDEQTDAVLATFQVVRDQTATQIGQAQMPNLLPITETHDDISCARDDGMPVFDSADGDIHVEKTTADLMPDLDDDVAILDDDDLLVAGDPFDTACDASPDSGIESDDLIELPQAELREGFYIEAEEHFQALGEALGALEAQVTGKVAMTEMHKQYLGQIRRAVHTVKGAAAVIKLTQISDWGHAFEDVLDWLYEEAEQIDTETVALVADASDMLEQYVTAPDEVDADKRHRLQDAFDTLVGTSSIPSSPSSSGDAATQGGIFVFDDKPRIDPILPPKPVQAQRPDGIELSDATGGRSKTLRVEMGKVEALVNLAGELIVALSAFDDKMAGLGDIITELERSRQRLKTTARDLEVGYEVKAIQHLGTHSSQISALTGPGEELPGEFDDFDLLELDRYSEFNLLIRSLNETTVDVNTISSQLTDVHSGFGAYLNRLRVLTSELQDKVMRIRMTPLATIVHRLRQTVRQTARTLDKNVRLVVTGEEIELDKQVWEKLADPLMHILRNAVDHGVESADRRAAAGKPDLATIELTAAYQGNQVILRIADDGLGLDYAVIREKAHHFNTPTPADQMSEAELAELIFLQGFSTRDQVSNISGRGVGLDVVRENIDALKGRVHIEHSAPDRGTTFIIRMPLTLAVMRALLFYVNDRLYATALYDIKEMLRIHPRDLTEENGQTYLKLGNRQLPFYQLSALLAPGIKAATADTSRRHLVLIVQSGEWQGAVAINSMHSQREIVIKNLGPHLRQVKGISGVTIMGDGKVVPIINLAELLTTTPLYQQPLMAQSLDVHNTVKNILVVDDSVSVRTVVSRLMQRQGWQVQTANDGVDAIEKLRDYRPDIILLDVEMPRMNGYEFMSALRSQDVFRNLPVVMLTSRSAEKHRDKARQLGVNGYVVKPYEDEALIGLIQKLIAQA